MARRIAAKLRGNPKADLPVSNKNAN